LFWNRATVAKKRRKKIKTWRGLEPGVSSLQGKRPSTRFRSVKAKFRTLEGKGSVGGTPLRKVMKRS